MSASAHGNSGFSRLQFIAGLAIIILAGVAGWWLGSLGRSAVQEVPVPVAQHRAPTPEAPPEEPGPAEEVRHPESDEVPEEEPILPDTPLPEPDLALTLSPENHAEALDASRAASVSRFAAILPLAWAESGGADAVVSVLAEAAEALPAAQFTLVTPLSPPPEWLAARPDASIEMPDGAIADVASAQWMDETCALLQDAAERLREAGVAERITGWALIGPGEGRWRRDLRWRPSPSQRDAFRAWLRERYENDGALADAWGQEGLRFDAADWPPAYDSADAAAAFFDGPTGAPYRDAFRYLSASTADAIRTLAGCAREALDPGLQVYTAYGHSLAGLGPASGQYALDTVLESGIDGILASGGLAASNGFGAPVDTLRLRGKRAVLIHPGGSGDWADALPFLSAEGDWTLQLGAAAVHDMPLIGQPPPNGGEESPLERARRALALADYIDARAAPPEQYDPDARPALAVVSHEQAAFWQRAVAPLAERLYGPVREAALRSGVPTRYVLLDDVLSGRAPAAEVYLFADAFQLTESTRERLHALLAEQGASAIWLYAPGYITSGEGLVENVARTVGMQVEVVEAPATAGSRIIVDGRWVARGDALGDATPWGPLFAINDESASVIATYVDSGLPSAAVVFVPEGWTSLYVAEPTMSVPLLRQLLDMLEARSWLDEADAQPGDTLLVGRQVAALSAVSPGRRTIDAGWPHAFLDLMDPSIGWPQRRALTLSLDETPSRLFLLARPADPEDVDLPPDTLPQDAPMP